MNSCLDKKYYVKIAEILSHNVFSFCKTSVNSIHYFTDFVAKTSVKSNCAPLCFHAKILILTDFILISRNIHQTHLTPVKTRSQAHFMFSWFLLSCQIYFCTFISAHPVKHRRSSQLLSAHFLRPQTHRRRLHRRWCHSSQQQLRDLETRKEGSVSVILSKLLLSFKRSLSTNTTTHHSRPDSTRGCHFQSTQFFPSFWAGKIVRHDDDDLDWQSFFLVHSEIPAECKATEFQPNFSWLPSEEAKSIRPLLLSKRSACSQPQMTQQLSAWRRDPLRLPATKQ